MRENTQTLEERYNSYIPIIEQSGCWRWPKTLRKDGYGTFWFQRKPKYAHRAAYIVNKGPIPKGEMVRHSCDNRWCVNPDHLSVGTAQDNVDDMVERDRQAKGSQDGNSKLKEHEVVDIWLSHSGPTALSEKYGVSRQTIHHIRTGKTWHHLTSTL